MTEPIHMPLQRSFLCECGLVNDNANRCACGNEYGLLNLASVLDRDTARNALGFINLQQSLKKPVAYERYAERRKREQERA